MNGIKSINLSLAFALEVCMIAAFVYWGFNLPTNIFFQIIAGVGVPVVITLLWGMWLAPNADLRLGMTWLVALKTVLFGLASVALISVNQSALGVGLLTAFAATEVLGLLWSQEKKN